MTSEEYKLKLGDKVEIGGDLWVWERVRRGVEATLRRDGAEDDWLVISMPELIGFAGTARRQSRTPLRPTAGDWPADVLDMEKHLLEVFRGVPMDPNAVGARPGYDLTQTTQEQRITAKVAELAGTSLARSRKALFNYWKVYESEGVAGVDARLHPKGQKRLVISKADPRLVAVIDRELDRRTNLHTSSRRHCAAGTAARIGDRL